MKTEIIKVRGRGMCILISGVNPQVLVDGALNIEHMIQNSESPFHNLELIAHEIRNKRKIAAIKEMRKQTGWGLKDSKEYIDRFIPTGTPEGFDYRLAAENFIIKHSWVSEGEFVSSDEMEIK